MRSRPKRRRISIASSSWRAGPRNSSLQSSGLRYCLVPKCPKGPTSLGLATLIRQMLSLGFDGGTEKLSLAVGAGSLGGAPVFPRGELHCDGGEDKEEKRRGREVPMPLDR